MDNTIYSLQSDPFKCCCVCYNDYSFIYNNQNDSVLDISLIEKSWFDEKEFPDELLVLSPCNNHFICIGCLRKISNNYENHPINENESHIYCPYPFEKCANILDFRYIFEHSHIEKILLTDEERHNFREHAEQYAFPGMTRVKCPCTYYGSTVLEIKTCNTDILVDNNDFKTKAIGELILECTQNMSCQKRFCYHCKKVLSFFQHICYTCSSLHENENPNCFNYYINKNLENELVSPFSIDAIVDFEFSYATSKYDPEQYLYRNKDITIEIALENISTIIESFENYMKCPVCQICLFKTEKCNGLAHHSIERCYVCGRIGYKVKGLGDHWNNYGCNGCYRFDTDSLVSIFIPEYKCSEVYCHNHDKGECNIPEHIDGIQKLIDLRKRSCIFHNILSLLPDTRLDVYDKLYEKYKNNEEYLNLLPFKQTFIILSKFKERSRDCIEEVIYDQLKLKFPTFSHRNEIIDIDLYLQEFKLQEEPEEEEIKTNLIPTINQIRAMRELIQSELEPLLQRRRRIFESLLDEPYESDIATENNPIEQQRNNPVSHFFYTEVQSDSDETELRSTTIIRNDDLYSIHSDDSDVTITNININNTHNNE